MDGVVDEVMAIAEADRETVEQVEHGGYIQVRERPSGKLLFEIAPERSLIRICRRRIWTEINLAQYGLIFVGGVDGGFA